MNASVQFFHLIKLYHTAREIAINAIGEKQKRPAFKTGRFDYEEFFLRRRISEGRVRCSPLSAPL